MMIAMAFFFIGASTALHYPIMAVIDGVRSELDFATWIMGKDLHFMERMRNTLVFGASTCMMSFALAFIPFR